MYVKNSRYFFTIIKIFTLLHCYKARNILRKQLWTNKTLNCIVTFTSNISIAFSFDYLVL